MSERRAQPTVTIALCAAMHGVGGGLGWSLLPPLMPDVARDLAMSHAASGLVWGSASLGIAVASPLGGTAVDRFGARRVAGVAMLVGALCCAARSLAFSGPSLAALMFLFGMHVGFVAPAIPKALAGHVPLSRLGRANGIAVLFYTLGTALSIALARGVVSPALGGWRNTMIAAAGAMALVAVVWLALVRDRTVRLPHARLRDVFALISNPAVRNVGAVHFLLFGGYLALLGILPRALLEAGLPPRRATVAIAAWLTLAAVANFAGPWLSDRIGRRKPFVVIGALVSGSALSVLALAPHSSAITLLAIAALGGGCFAPLLLTMPAELPGVGPAKAGAALGLLMLIGQIGGFLLPALAGAALQTRGFSAAIGALAIAHLLIVIPALRLRDARRTASDGAPSRESLPAAEAA